MVAAATARSRVASPAPTPVLKKRLRPSATWLLIGIPLLLAAAVAWQLISSTLRTEVITREAVSVGRVSLEPVSDGVRIDLVLVDRVGQQTTADAMLQIKLREPDGALWQTSRAVSVQDFHPLADGGLLGGRLGYSIVVPARDWARPPRHGGAATVNVSVTPAGGSPSFSTVAEERFP